jgi:hypothetical protein
MTTARRFKTMVMIAFSLLLLLYFSGCAGTKQTMLDAGLKPMTSQELKSQFATERTAKVHVLGAKDRWYTYIYRPDGTLTIQRKLKRETKTRYRFFSIANDQVCVKKKLTSKNEECSAWFKVAPDTYQTYAKDGTILDKQILN